MNGNSYLVFSAPFLFSEDYVYSLFEMKSLQPDKLPYAVVVCGPTGIGKTSFAIELARRFKGEIIGDTDESQEAPRRATAS